MCHEVASEFFATNAPNPPHWTLNSCFVVFPTIWVHLGPFGCLTKLSAKWAELVQMFVPRSRVGILNNERTRSTPLDPKLMFCCVSYNLGVFWTVWLPYKTRCKIGQTSAKVRAMTSCRNFSQRTHPVVRNAPKHEFRVQWCGSGAFVAKCSCHEVASEFFATNAPDPPPLHPKLMFWCVLYHLGAFGTVKLPYETRGKTFRTSAKVRATKLRRIILQRTHTIHPIRP